MENQERLINGVLKGDISVVDDVMAENISVSYNNMEALRAANMKLFEAKTKVLAAESIVEMLEIGCAANERVLSDGTIDEEMPLYRLIQSMSEGNKDAKIILGEIAKASSKSDRYLIDMNRLGIRGDRIVATYDFCGFSMEKLFEVMDYEDETGKLIIYLSELKLKGDSENG